jgi:hypothetical protein
MKTDLPGRYYEKFGKSGLTFLAFFDSFDVGESEPKIDHTIAIIARLQPLLQDQGFPPIKVFGQASHTGAHDFNLKLAKDREFRLILDLTTLTDNPIPAETINPIDPDSVDLHEDSEVKEHKRFRRAGLQIMLADLSQALPVLIDPPSDLDHEAD